MIKERGTAVIRTTTGSSWIEGKQADGSWKPIVPVTQSTHSARVIDTAKIKWDGARRSGPIKKTRRCHHVVERDDPCSPITFYTYGDVAHKQRAHYRNWVPTNVMLPSITVPSYSISVHLQDALDFFGAGCVDQEVDLVTNIIELPSLKSLCSSLITRFKRLKAAKIPSLKTIAGDHLAYSFGIKPLIADIKSLVQTASYMEKHIAWLRSNQGKITPVRYTVDLTNEYRPSDFLVNGNTQYETWCRYRQFSAKLTCFALVRYNTQGLRDAELTLRALLRRLGVDNPLAIMWENIPFSLVFDWVIDIGGFLGALAPKIRIPVEYLDCGYSIKTVVDRDVVFSSKPAYSGSGLPALIQRQHLTNFFREPGLPISYGMADMSAPSTRQLVLGLSLAVQRYSK